MSPAHLHLVDEGKTSATPQPKRRAKKLDAQTEHKPNGRSAEEPREAASGTTKKPREKTGEAKRSSTAKRKATAADVMSTPALSCTAETPLNDAVRLMWENDVGAVVIVSDEGRPVGMITDRDACMAAYTQGVALHQSRVSSAMAQTVVLAELDTPIDELRERMSRAQLRRLPIVDRTGTLAGIVGLSDLSREAHAALPKDRKRGSSGAMLLQLFDSILQRSVQ